MLAFGSRKSPLRFPVRFFGPPFVFNKMLSFVSGSFFRLILCFQQLSRFVF